MRNLILPVLCLTLAGVGQPEPAVDAFIRAEMARQQIPGLALAIVRNGKPVALEGYGVSNLEHQVPVTPDTMFQSASVGKQFTAAAVMMLAALAIVVASIAVALRTVPLETFGMSANFGPDVVWRVFLAVAPFTLLAAALLTVVASFTRTYKEAQSWLGLVLLVATVPIALASVLEVAPEAPLMLVPSLSQHLLIQGLIRGDPLPASWAVIAATSCLALGVALAWLAGRLYRREAILG